MTKRTTLPKGVWFQRKVLATGEVVRYGYFGRGVGMEPLGREGSADFHQRLAEVLRRAPVEGKVSHLIWRYKNDEKFRGLRPRTQADYQKHLTKIQAKFGGLRVGVLELPQMSDRFYQWRDELAKASPRQADYTISVLNVVLAFAVRRGLLAINRASGIEDVYSGDRSAKTYSEEQEAAIMAVASPAMRLVAIMALEIGAAQEDLLILPRSARLGNIIVGERLKNGTPFAVPISPRLAAALDALPEGLPLAPILTRDDGLPFDPKGNGLRAQWRATTAAAGITERTFHDMRGTFITRRRAMGWTAEQVALCSGHKIAGEKGAQSGYADRKAIAIANAQRLWAEWYGPKAEQKLQTGLQTAGLPDRLTH